jgi:sugar/nucleoside kinase (ribokinase family)
MKIATVGVHVLDTHVIGIESIPDGSDGQLVETIRMSPAGTAGGTAVVLSRLGAEVLGFGAVGEDPIATSLLALLAHEGVDVTGLVRKADHQTSASVIPVRPNGDRPAWHCIGANGAFTLDDLDRGALDGITHLHLGGPEFLGGEAAGQLLAHARSIGATTSLDILAPGDPDMLAWIADALPHTDYLLPNDEQVLGFTGASSLADGARALVDAGAGCVAVTQGSKGALVVTADETIEVPAYVVDVVDTTGCGDAFSAGFLRGLSLGRDLRGAAELGCAAAAQVAQGLGTDAGCYTLDSVVAFAETADRR